MDKDHNERASNQLAVETLMPMMVEAFHKAELASEKPVFSPLP